MKTQREINNTNRKRGAVMERRIMKKMRGNRVPMSGAGALKGDGFVHRLFGLFLVECKLSAATHTVTGEGLIRADIRWLVKIASEAKSMRAKFGIVVIHLHGDFHDYVIIEQAKYHRYFPGTILEEPVVEFATAMKYTLAFTRHKLDLLRHQWYGTVSTRFGEYYIMHIDRFMELLDDLYREVKLDESTLAVEAAADLVIEAYRAKEL